MFNRNEKSYHDNIILTEIDISRYLDKFSAYYLKPCFNPELPMRCREDETPKIHMNGLGIRNVKTCLIPTKEIV